jgi:hypothetical protein
MKEKSFASLPVFLVDDEESVLHATAALLHSAGVANIRDGRRQPRTAAGPRAAAGQRGAA